MKRNTETWLARTSLDVPVHRPLFARLIERGC